MRPTPQRVGGRSVVGGEARHEAFPIPTRERAADPSLRTRTRPRRSSSRLEAEHANACVDRAASEARSSRRGAAQDLVLAEETRRGSGRRATRACAPTRITAGRYRLGTRRARGAGSRRGRWPSRVDGWITSRARVRSLERLEEQRRRSAIAGTDWRPSRRSSRSSRGSCASRRRARRAFARRSGGSGR